MILQSLKKIKSGRETGLIDTAPFPHKTAGCLVKIGITIFKVTKCSILSQFVRHDLLKYPIFIHKTFSFLKVSKGAKIRNRYNQVPHLTQDTNGKVTNSQLDTTNESQEVSPFQQVTKKHI